MEEQLESLEHVYNEYVKTQKEFDDDLLLDSILDELEIEEDLLESGIIEKEIIESDLGCPNYNQEFLNYDMDMLKNAEIKYQSLIAKYSDAYLSGSDWYVGPSFIDFFTTTQMGYNKYQKLNNVQKVGIVYCVFLLANYFSKYHGTTRL